MRRLHIPMLLAGLIIGLIGLAATPQGCLACSCPFPGTPPEELARTSTVFRGRVTAIDQVQDEQGYRSLRVTLQATATWKGAVTPEMIVHTGLGGGDCGYPFKQGVDYLIYANGLVASGAPANTAGRLYTGTCSRTRPIADAAEDLAALGAGQPVGATPLPRLPNTGSGVAPARDMALTTALTIVALLATLVLGNLRWRRR